MFALAYLSAIKSYLNNTRGKFSSCWLPPSNRPSLPTDFYKSKDFSMYALKKKKQGEAGSGGSCL